MSEGSRGTAMPETTDLLATERAQRAALALGLGVTTVLLREHREILADYDRATVVYAHAGMLRAIVMAAAEEHIPGCQVNSCVQCSRLRHGLAAIVAYDRARYPEDGAR